MAIEKIVIAGGGTMGSQIAFQIAFSGLYVTIYDVSPAASAAAKRRVMTWDRTYMRERKATPAVIKAANDHLRYATDLETAVEDADLVIETIPEVVAVKNEFYASLAKVAPDKTIFATSTSTMVPSQFSAITGRPGKFLALHFTNHVWANHLAEIMGHPGTDPAVFQEVVTFVRQIGLIPIQLEKEHPAYILNAMLDSFLSTALMLWVEGVADFETIDRTWMMATDAVRGPFAVLDEIGLQTAYQLMLGASAEPGREGLVMVAHRIKVDLIDQHRLGQETGAGFYQYPHPAYQREGFLQGK
ncbi:3-hydroxyacyl-CoA dehydrogenase [Levilactobacillus tujiorum]|uniref:3-hydroxyacyl-CoA dehydrogenase n=1 Tax=Levilactobacillus tujiorum TaxID=2912243 RepID=UPI00145679BE|nr:3-hydroxyacyl-CoA dehydrogenase [Levilactobacillus tujiorum]NLR31454.1 3-hydroxyacyl-CoA dehydrogenase [Levilactobacillus tujiorum]